MKKRNTTLKALVLGLALLGANEGVSAQSAEDALRFTERLPATGARLTGMAGASIAGIADWSTVHSNPAGLSLLETSQIVGSFGTTYSLDEATFSVGQNAGTLTEQTSNSTGLGSLAYVNKVPTARGSLSFGIGFNKTNSFDRALSFKGNNSQNSLTDFLMPLSNEFTVTEGLGDDGIAGTEDDVFDIEFTRPLSFMAYETFGIDFDRTAYENGEAVPFLPAVSAGTLEQRGEVFESGGMRDMTFAGSVEVAQNVHVGLGMNLNFGEYRYERFFDETDINDDNNGENGTTDFAALDFREDLTVGLFGANMRAGVTAIAFPGFRIGATIETPTYYWVEEDFYRSLDTSFDNGDSYSQDDSSIGYQYSISTPWRIGIGGAFETAGLLISADAELVDWSQLRMNEVDGTLDDVAYFDEINRSIRTDYDAVVNFRLGLEYDFGRAAIRGGYAIQPDSRANDGLAQDREFVSLGVGFKVAPNVRFDIGWMHQEFDDQYSPYSEVVDAPVINELINRDNVSLGLTVGF